MRFLQVERQKIESKADYDEFKERVKIYQTSVLSRRRTRSNRGKKTEYVGDMIEEFSEECTKQPWSQDTFDVDPESASLTDDAAAMLHTFVAKGLVVTKERNPIFFLQLRS